MALVPYFHGVFVLGQDGSDDITAICRCRKTELLPEVVERHPQHIGGRVPGGALTEGNLGGLDRLLHRGPILGQTNQFLVEDRVGDEPAAEAFEEKFFCADQLLLL
ncbi:MAG TPA: hypothetical protein VFG23_18015 [Polyangia bacterium]|nr:hypothetical protein [Polyangia bacterium]